jgi:hypothetical protein
LSWRASTAAWPGKTPYMERQEPADTRPYRGEQREHACTLPAERRSQCNVSRDQDTLACGIHAALSLPYLRDTALFCIAQTRRAVCHKTRGVFVLPADSAIPPVVEMDTLLRRMSLLNHGREKTSSLVCQQRKGKCSMFALKLFLTPLFIGLISLAERRWGGKVGGWLVGLPLTSAPVTFFLAVELGTTFAAHTAASILLGLISQAAFCVAYARLSLYANWLVSWLIGWGVFCATTVVFTQVSLPPLLAFLSVLSALLFGLWLWPASAEQSTQTRAPAWATPGRMLMATGVVLALTGLARPVGPHLSGLLSPLPVFATVFAIFAHILQGGAAARQILHGVMVSSFACSIFFLLIAQCLSTWGIGATWSAATLAALLIQGCALWIKRRQTTPIRRQA